MKRVLVTGANGHLGYTLSRLLVENGYQVRAGVRDSGNAEKTRHLRALGVEVCETRLLEPETLAAAAAGMEGVFHVAAALRMWAPDPQKEIIEPTVRGAVSMLEAARAAGVQKVIYTSSTGAVGLDSTPEQPLTEADWTQHSTLPYIRAKTEAEHAVWDFAARHRLNVVAIQPGMILGPYFYRETPSTWIIASILRRKFPAAPPFGAGFVDVRDAARAELLAYENPAASGRYLTVNGPFVSMADVMRLVHEIDPTVRVNTKQLPGWAMQVGVFLDWLGYRLLGRPRELPRAMLDEFVGRYVCYSHAKASRELGWEPMDFKTSVRDTMDWLRKNLAQKRL